MTTAPKKNRGAVPEGHPPEVRALAYKTWLDSGKPSFSKLAALMEKQGLKVDKTTLVRWAGKDKNWNAEKVIKDDVKPEKLLSALAKAKADANTLDADHFIGVKAQLVARLYGSIVNMPLTNIDEWTRALACCEQIDALIHNERGKAVREAASNGAPVSTSLLDKLNPPVSIAPFTKKPNGGA